MHVQRFVGGRVQPDDGGEAGPAGGGGHLHPQAVKVQTLAAAALCLYKQ